MPGSVRDVRLKGAEPPGRLTINDDGTFLYEPPLHFSGPVSFTYAFVDIRTGREVEAVATIAVDPVADPARLTVPAQRIVTAEDTPVALGGLSGALVDMDGSETGVFRITGVPAGSTFGGKGRNLGGGVWEFAPAEMGAPLTFAPPQNLHGVFSLVLEGVTTESANGDRATVSRPFTVEITAVADAPAASNVTATGDEDTGLAAGAAIPLILTDADGSERVSSVAISAPPAGWVFGTVAVAGVTYAPDGAGGLIVSGPTTAAIRAALDGLTVTPPANADDDAFVSYTVTTTDADGSTASATGRLDLVVRPVGDGVALSATPVAVEEDSWVNFGGAITLARRDNDGSEEITRIEVTGFGTASARWTAAGGATVTAIPGGYASPAARKPTGSRRWRASRPGRRRTPTPTSRSPSAPGRRIAARRTQASTRWPSPSPWTPRLTRRR